MPLDPRPASLFTASPQARADAFALSTATHEYRRTGDTPRPDGSRLRSEPYLLAPGAVAQPVTFAASFPWTPEVRAAVATLEAKGRDFATVDVFTRNPGLARRLAGR